jgi:cysteinyl-tRNA synthetase
MAHYWLHGAFLEEESGKMSKSTGEFLRLKVLIDKGYSPLDYRYLCLGTHYRKRLLFSWELLDQAKTAFDRLKQNILMMRQRTENKINGRDAGIPAGVRKEFKEAVNDDLNMPQALAVMWGVVRDEKLTDFEKLNLLYDFNSVLGLDLHKITEEKNDTEVPEEVMQLINKRIEAKNAKDFKLADELRAKVKELGYDIVDKKEGAEVKKIKN